MATTRTTDPRTILRDAHAGPRHSDCLGQTPPPSPAYAATRHILESPRIAARTRPHVQDQDFDWLSLLAEAETMSGGERLLVKIAHDLWEATGEVDVREIPQRLGPSNFERVLLALRIARGDAVP
jgi:hypothetical protein